MGMFDNVDFEMKCPVCGSIIHDFQTKSMVNRMVTFKTIELPKESNFYSSCRKCGLYAEFITHRLDNEKERKEKIKRILQAKDDDDETQMPDL